jgi:hypothetical protein
VLVADNGNDRVVELASGGSVVRQWGSRGSSDGRFRAPSGIGVGTNGEVFVLDGGNNRVQVFDGGGRFLGRWGLRGTALGAFSQPMALAVDCAGAVYVADTNNNRVQRFLPHSPTPGRCLPAGAWPPPLDVAPVLRVSLLRRTGVLARRALALSVSCLRGCKVLAGATLAPGRGRAKRAVALVSAARPLAPGLPGHLRLRVGGRALRQLRRELGPRRALRARVSVTAVGPTGRRTVVTRTYAVAR